MTVNKANVYEEVAKTTSYAGAKAKEDDGAYQRIFTTDADRQMLERFWVETCGAATEEFKRFIVSVSSQPESHGVDLERDYHVELEVSGSFDLNLRDSMETSLFSFFVASIVGKWCKFTDKESTAGYGEDMEAALADVRSKLYYRKRPQRVRPTKE